MQGAKVAPTNGIPVSDIVEDAIATNDLELLLSEVRLRLCVCVYARA